MGKVFIGVDPGKSGAIAALVPQSDPVIIRLDGTDWDVVEELRDVVSGEACFAMLEKVHSMPGQGVASSFKFGQSFGKLEMLLACLEIPFDYVTPAKWQGDMGCRTKGDKNITKAAAQRLFPSLKITHRNADALLLAEYARRVEGGRA